MKPIALYLAEKLEDTHPSDDSTQLFMYNAADELKRLTAVIAKLEEALKVADEGRNYANELLSLKAQEGEHIRRWNIEPDGDDLLICDGNHDKHEKCEYIRYTPASTVKAQAGEPIYGMAQQRQLNPSPQVRSDVGSLGNTYPTTESRRNPMTPAEDDQLNDMLNGGPDDTI